MQAARNIAQAFNGINMKCASCHDSFTDHWQLADTYAVANCFSDTPLELVRCDVPLGKPAKYGYFWPELGEVDGSQPKNQRMARIAELTTAKDNGFFARTIVNRLWHVSTATAWSNHSTSSRRSPGTPNCSTPSRKTSSITDTT